MEKSFKYEWVLDWNNVFLETHLTFYFQKSSFETNWGSSEIIMESFESIWVQI